MSTFEIVEVELPDSDDREAWVKYWKSKNQSWQTEPIISKELQEYLAERRKIEPDDEQGIYPYKDIDPNLSRADIECLLATHENGRGRVDWKDESQREREGLDLRGADLRGVDLRALPLAKIIAGFGQFDFFEYDENEAQIEAASIHLEGTFLNKAHLEGVDLSDVHLEGAFLYSVLTLHGTSQL